MGLFSGGAPGPVERRDAFALPPIPPNSTGGYGGGIRRVDLSSSDNAMRKVAIFSAVNLLASMAETIPLETFSGDETNKIRSPRWLDDLGGTGYGTPDFSYQCMYSLGITGNILNRVVERDPVSGKPRTMDMLHADKVRVDPTNDRIWYVNGVEVDASQIDHRRAFPVPGMKMGLSPIAMHATTIGTGIAALNFGAQWFVDGAHPSGMLTNDELPELNQTQALGMKARFLSAIRGTREPVIMTGGWKYQAIQIAPAESQFIETQEYTSAECARIYGPGMPEILGYKVGNSMTYANIEQRSLDLLTYSVDPWLVRLERFYSSLLPQPQFVRFNRAALLQTDLKTRFEAHQIALKNGWKVINDVRTEEAMPHVAWGDEPYLPAMGSSAAAAAENDGVNPDTGSGTDTGGTPPKLGVVK